MWTEPIVIAMWRRAATIAMGLALVACGADAAPPEASVPSRLSQQSGTGTGSPAPSPSAPVIEPAPGSGSVVYPPNPSAILVAIDAGHGGCLDWGVPDPSARGVELAEKTLTLEIARRLADLLEADGIRTLMIRDEDEALAGDLYPPLGCEGQPFRDVNGDGLAGFGEASLPEATRTRDELQARLDLANLARADALVSIHINSPVEGGQRIEIAFSETFYTDETPWGPELTARLAEKVQAGVVERLAPLAGYERGDRGTTAHNFYLVAPPLLEETAERPNRWAQPTRGGLMPVVLAEVGSITLRAEHDLLATAAGQEAVAAGLFGGLVAFFAERPIAARIGPASAIALDPPEPVPGEGPPFWPPILDDGPMQLRLTNTGTAPWPEDARLVAGWEQTDAPYLAIPPDELMPLDADVPPLEPGASAVLEVDLPAPPAGRAVAWISLMIDGDTTAAHGSPAFQFSTGGP